MVARIKRRREAQVGQGEHPTSNIGQQHRGEVRIAGTDRIFVADGDGRIDGNTVLLGPTLPTLNV